MNRTNRRWVVTVPLILLAIPSIIIGFFTIQPVLFDGWLTDSIFVLPQNDTVAERWASISMARWRWRSMPCRPHPSG